MISLRQQRILAVCCILVGILAAVGLALYALRGNINLFYTPSQIKLGQVPQHYTFRVGGMVEKGSVHYSVDHAAVSFRLTDTTNEITVYYRGILPDLFREGQGIVSQGKLDQQGRFMADQVLAKHDANYMPPEVITAIKQAKGAHHAT